jgi:hypothetical protein
VTARLTLRVNGSLATTGTSSRPLVILGLLLLLVGALVLVGGAKRRKRVDARAE